MDIPGEMPESWPAQIPWPPVHPVEVSYGADTAREGYDISRGVLFVPKGKRIFTRVWGAAAPQWEEYHGNNDNF